jgi:hypothetical protein
MKLLIQNIYCNAWNNPDLFTTKIDHNGFFYWLRDNLTYISGTTDYFDNCHSETFSMLWVEEFMHVLDYQFDGRLHWRICRMDISVQTEKDVLPAHIHADARWATRRWRGRPGWMRWWRRRRHATGWDFGNGGRWRWPAEELASWLFFGFLSNGMRPSAMVFATGWCLGAANGA